MPLTSLLFCETENAALVQWEYLGNSKCFKPFASAFTENQYFFITVKWVLGLNYLDPLELLHKYTNICQSNFLY